MRDKMSFNIGKHRRMTEMFVPCPKCYVRYLIRYEDGAECCTYCGYHSSASTVNKEVDE